MSLAPADWFRTESTLLDELRAALPAHAGPPAIAGYEELVELRRGGQGIVYSATQASTRRRTAVKVLLESAPSLASRRRFEREVDLAAGLRHPNIVRVYDSGATPDGRPYLVMEFIDGPALDEYLRQRQWPGPAGAHARDVAALFAKIARAAEHAHRLGVIHRDLKPSNIRIARQNDEPVILDFGLAKAAAPGESPPADGNTLSGTGQFLGSLAWASPEQARGEATDTRADVYALGVMLFHALTGAYPYDLKGSLRDSLDRIATAAPARPRAIAPWIDRDLEVIVLTCLAKDPARRYQSAGALAADLDAWRTGEPIAARADSRWYLIRAAARRNRAAALAAAAVFTLAVAASVLFAVLYARANRAEADARTQAQAASTAEKEARRQADARAAANNFIRDVFSAADPVNLGRDARIADALKRAVRKLEQSPGLPAETATAVRETIGATYLSLGMIPEAEPLILSAAADRLALYGADDPDTIAADVRTAELRIAQGNLDEGLALARRADQRAASALPPNHRVRVTAAHALATAQFHKGDYPAAEAAVARALAEARAGGADDETTIGLAGDLALIYKVQSKFPQAEALYTEQLARLRASPERNDPMLISLLNSLSSLLQDTQRTEPARAMLTEALELSENSLGPDHTLTLTVASNMAMLLMDERKFDDALPFSRRIYETLTRVQGPRHPVTLGAMNNLAKLRQDMGDLDEAERLFAQCAQARREVLGDEHPHTLITLNNLSGVYAARGKVAEALQTNQSILAIRRRTLAPGHMDILISCNNVANLLQRSGRAEEARPLFEEAVAGAVAKLGEKHATVGVLRGNLGRCLAAVGDAPAAEAALRSAVEINRAALGETDPRTRLDVKSLADLLRKTGRAAEADALDPPAQP